MINKFQMSVEDNVEFAKRQIVDSIYKEARVEGNYSILAVARRWSFRSLSHLWAFRRMLPYLIRGIEV